MGICDIFKKNEKEISPKEPKNLKKDNQILSPETKKEIDELYTYESAICKIKFQTIKDGEIHNGIGTGFFCEINDDIIPFKKALFTNNHVLNEINIDINKDIEFDYLKEPRKIKITKNRRTFTNKTYDYTCIEIFDADKIQNYFKIDLKTLENKNNLKGKEILILQYPNGELSHSLGIITDYNNETIEHKVSTSDGSSGSPLIKRYDNNFIYGIHYGTIWKIKEIINSATPLDIILKDIKKKLAPNDKDRPSFNETIKLGLIINLTYDTENDKSFHGSLDGSEIFDGFNIFGKRFVENNKDNVELIINNKKYELMERYDSENGIINVQMIILNKLTNIECMFKNCKSLINIDDLQYLDTTEITDFSSMFEKCVSLKNIDALINWDVSNGKNFTSMFAWCHSLPNLRALQNWNVSNGNNFSRMFTHCSSLEYLGALKNWNVSNGYNFKEMFHYCSSLSNLEGLENWYVSNGINFKRMFAGCSSLSNIKSLQKWNVLNGEKFNNMFDNNVFKRNMQTILYWNFKNSEYFHNLSDCYHNNYDSDSD